MFFSVSFEPNAISARHENEKWTTGLWPLTKRIPSKVVADEVGLE
jgi:hypothetical protein